MKKLWIIIFILAAAFISPHMAQGKPKKKKAKKAAQEEKPKAPDYIVILVKGHNAYIIKDYDKALNLYKDAAERSTKNPMPHYFIGCAYRALKKYDDAIDAFKTAFLMASDSGWWKGIASFNIALTYEAAGKLEEAVEAWEDFKSIAVDTTGLKKYVTTAEKRIKAIENYIELDKKYEKVRERIAAGEES